MIDSSDVLCIVLDARDPLGTSCKETEKILRDNYKFKHVVYILNKVDLIPTHVTKKWVKYLSKSYPTIPYKASLKGNFGRENLIDLLR